MSDSRTRTTTHFSPALVAIASALVLACSGGEPSEGDIMEAMQAESDKTFAQMSALVGETMAEKAKPELHGVKKVACVEASNQAGYNCDVEVDISGPLGRQTSKASIRLVDGDEGWTIVSN